MRHQQEYGDSGWRHYNPFDEKKPRDNFSPNDSFGPRDSDKTLLQDDVPVRDSHRSGGGDEWREVDPGITRLQFDETEPSGRKKERIPENIETDVGLGEISVNIGIVPTDDIGSGLSVVVGVDVNPLQVDVNMNGDVGSASIGVGLPGDLLGLNAEISIDMDTGQRIGGGLGVEISGFDVGVNVVTHDGKICTTVTITYMGVGASYTHCREDDEDDDEKDPPPEPDPPPKGEEDDLEPIPPPPQENPLPGNPDDYVYYFFTQQTAKQNKRTWFKYGKKTLKWQHRWVGYDSLTYQNGYGQEIFPPIRLLNGSLQYRYSNENGVYCESADSWSNGEGTHSGQYCEVWSFNWSITQASPFVVIQYSGLKKHFNFPGRSTSSSWNIHHNQNLEYYGEESWEVGNEWSVWNLAIAFVNNFPVDISPPPGIPLPPDIPIHPPEKKMDCCNLEPVMSLLRKVATVLDAENFNVQMPQSVILKEDGQELAPGVLQINNYAEFLNYLFQRDDERWGAFGISVKVEDTDPLTGGNQEKDFYLPNLAESIAEMYGILLQLAIDGQLQKHLAVKNLTEASKQAVTNTKNYYLLDAIADYLGFKTSEKNLMIPLLCKLAHDPEKEINMDEFITETETAAKVIEFADEGTLQTTLAELKQAAAIIRALHYRPVNPYGDINTQIKDYVMSKSPDNEKIWEKFVEKLSGEFLPDSDPNKGSNPNGPTIEEVPNI